MKVSSKVFFPKQHQPVFNQINQLISCSKEILIISHRGPDADTVGANLALGHYLKSLNKNITFACSDPIPKNLKFLNLTSQFQQKITPEKHDLIITVDCGSSKMVNYFETTPSLKNSKIINIDHHRSNDYFGTINLVDPETTSTTTTIFHFLSYNNFHISPQTATCLLAGIYFDTGSFMHPNTSQETYTIAAELIGAGANFHQITQHLFRNQSTTQLQLWGKILQRTHISNKKIVVSIATQNDLKEFESTSENLQGLIDFLNMVPNTKLSLLLSEDQQGNIKASCRTQSDKVDVSKLANLFGGGGHQKAAGFSIKGNLSKDIFV